MKLIEEGRVRLNDPVSQFIPEFGRFGKSAITIRHLLTHTSGLRPDLELEVEFHGSDEAIRRASDEVPSVAAGRTLRLQRHQFFPARRHRAPRQRRDARSLREGAHFEPLGMSETSFLPPESWRPRIAPTEACATAGLAVRWRRSVPPRRSSTIRPRGAWTASRDTPGCSAPPPICRASAACCSAADDWETSGYCRRQPSRA